MPKHVSAEFAAALVKDGDWVDYGINTAQPELFDRALAARKDRLRDVRIRSCLALSPRAVVEADPDGTVFTVFSWHLGGWERTQSDAGRLHYIPMNFGEAPDLYRRFVDRVDVACIRTAPMDENGYFNFGPSVTYLKALTERAKTLIVETSAAIPHVCGVDEAVHASEVDYVIEGEAHALPDVASPAPNDTDRRIARLIATEIEDGACLQIGIGGMPNAVCSTLRDAGIRDLGVHSEMLVDGMLDLYEAGLITGARKRIDVGKMVFTFVQSRRLYGFIDRNPAVRGCPVDYTNLPHNIAQNDRVVSINTTMQLDLQGQAASESNGHRHISGTGGQLQFVRGAYASRGGKSFLCLSSVYERHGQRRSRIVTSLPQGSIVTTPRTDVMYVVTEHGIANLKGLSVPERAKALIALAHPDFREDLAREARDRRLVPRAFW